MLNPEIRDNLANSLRNHLEQTAVISKIMGDSNEEFERLEKSVITTEMRVWTFLGISKENQADILKEVYDYIKELEQA